MGWKVLQKNPSIYLAYKARCNYTEIQFYGFDNPVNNEKLYIQIHLSLAQIPSEKLHKSHIQAEEIHPKNIWYLNMTVKFYIVVCLKSINCWLIIYNKYL